VSFMARSWLASALLAVMVTGSLSVLTGAAAAAPGDIKCAGQRADGSGLAAASEVAAQALAEDCGARVEVLAKASETTKVWALPSGEFEFESWAEPKWTRRGGSWVDINTNLVVGDDGLARPVASIANVEFSLGGDGPFARMVDAGGDFSLSWPAPLPKGIIDGDSITYPEVYPGVDLVARAERSGFSHLLVVKSAEAARNPAVRETRYLVGGSASLAEDAGGLRIAGPGGVIAAAPPPMAWDSASVQRPAGSASPHAERSSVRGPGDTANRAPVGVRVRSKELTVAIDDKFLEAADFPVYIDPTYDKKWARWAPVSDDYPNTAWTSGTSWPREVARVGSNWDKPSEIWRSHFYFDTSVLAGKRLKAGTTSVDAYLVHTGWCAGETIGIWQTNSIASNTPTWNNMKDKWLHGGALQTKVGKANSMTCGQSPNWLKFDASGIGYHVQRHADAGYTSITFGLRMATESGQHWAKFDPANVKLKTTYEHKPTSPVAVRTAPGGSCSTASPGPWINSRTPTLYGKASDGDGTVKVEFQLSGPTSPAIYKSPSTTSGAERGWTTPSLAEGNYQWRVRGTDDVDYTAWTGYCYFRVDYTPPTTPVVERTSGTPVVGQPVTLKLTSTDGRSGVKAFAYGIGVDAKEKTAPSTGSTTITFTPELGRTVVYVWALDNAGNYSNRTTFDVFTGRITEAQPEGAWRLDGDAFDDAGRDHDLVLGSGVTYGPDRKGRANSALVFDGTGCAETTPVIRTDVEFTISAWVQLADKNADYTALRQVASNGYALSLHYLSASDRWRIVVTDGNAPADTYTFVNSSAAPAVGVWQHLAATVDPVAKILRLYVDGVLVGERSISHPLWNAQGRFLIGCGGDMSSTWSRLKGSIDHVGVWQGLLSDAQIVRAATELPAGLVGQWQLRGDGADSSDFGRDIAVPDGTSWIDDQFGRAESALKFTGEQCAAADTAVVRTDESFTVAAWARADVADQPMTVVMQRGQIRSGFKLTRWSDNRWTFHMPSVDADGAQWYAAQSKQAAILQRWQHVVGVYDATAREVRLYVDGVLQQTVAAPHTPWSANAPMILGCTLTGSDQHEAFLTGALSDVRAWRGALTTAEVAEVYGGNPPVQVRALWPLDGPGSFEPTYLTDISGNGHDLTVSGAYSWVRDRGFGRDGALGLELATDSCAETTGPVVRTDASFTVTAWVLLEQVTGDHTVVSQAAEARSGFQLKYDPTAARWQFELASAGVGSATWHKVLSKDAPQLGKWTHLAGVYDVAAGKVRFYVDGVLQGEADGPASPWMAGGPTLIGCSGTISGSRSQALGGVVDDVRIWSSTLHPDRIADLAAG